MDKWILTGLLAAMLVGSHALSYKYGSFVGATEVSGLWAEENKKRQVADAKFQKENAALMAAHTERQKSLEAQLEAASNQYADSLRVAHDEFAERLRNAETRTDVYQRKARGSEAEREYLARHAAELDRSLEEGRALVRELGATLRQREVTIRALGGIILNDRTLLEPK